MGPWLALAGGKGTISTLKADGGTCAWRKAFDTAWGKVCASEGPGMTQAPANMPGNPMVSKERHARVKVIGRV